MMKLKQLCIAAVLTLALAFTALAGNMDTPAVTPPPPDQPSVTGEISTPGVTAIETSSSGSTAIDSVTGLALYLFDGMTSGF